MFDIISYIMGTKQPKVIELNSDKYRFEDDGEANIVVIDSTEGGSNGG